MDVNDEQYFELYRTPPTKITVTRSPPITIMRACEYKNCTTMRLMNGSTKCELHNMELCFPTKDNN